MADYDNIIIKDRNGDIKKELYPKTTAGQVVMDTTMGSPTIKDEIEKIKIVDGVQEASITQKGVVILSNSIDSISETMAATPNAVKLLSDTVAEKYVTKEKIGISVASLDTNGKIPTEQLPSYVDDVIEGIVEKTVDNILVFKVAGSTIPMEIGKIYIDVTTNISYRWGGTILAPITTESGNIKVIQTEDVEPTTNGLYFKVTSTVSTGV